MSDLTRVPWTACGVLRLTKLCWSHSLSGSLHVRTAQNGGLGQIYI